MSAIVVANTYRLIKKIGEGSFGKIFSALNKNMTELEANGAAIKYAVKILATPHTALFENEVAVYEKIKGVKYIPTLYASGIAGKFNYMVLDLFGQSLEELRKEYKEQMALHVVLHLSLQMLSIIEAIHDRGIVHRDLKPANFLIHPNPNGISELYLIDFGLARGFLDEKLKHCTMHANEAIVGTLRYMSVNMQQGLTASRRDDLETLGYIMLFLYHGQLWWQNTNAKNGLEIKQQFNWMMNTVGDFVLFIQYCRNLGFSDKPNYTYLRNIIKNCQLCYTSSAE